MELVALFLRSTNSIFFAKQKFSREGLSIETGIDWVNPRMPLRVSAHILGLNIEAGIDWVNPRVPLRASVHILDRIVSNLSSLKLSDFDYSADQTPLAVFTLTNWK